MKQQTKKHKEQLESLAKSFVNAFRGLVYCINNERNMRIHLVVACFVIFFAQFYNFSRAETVILIIAIVIVITTEMINTAIEVIMDLNSPGFSKHAKAAKDIAAGAVLICAIFSACVGVELFIRLDKLMLIINYFLSHPLYSLLLCIGLITGILFIFKWNNVTQRLYLRQDKDI